MNIANPFSLDFLATKPNKAALVLQSLDTELASVYLTNVPIRILTPVIENIETWPAARILESMPAEQSCAVLSQMKFSMASSIIRHLETHQRQLILSELPGHLVRAINRSLRYAEDSVGAWMDGSTPHFSNNLTVEECIKLLKNAGKACDIIVTVDANHCIEGVIPPGALFVNGSNRKLKDIADTRCKPLPAQTGLKVAESDASWLKYSTLPVRGRRGELVGSINHRTLSKALKKNTPKYVDSPGDSPIIYLSQALLASFKGILALTANSVVDKSPQEK